MNRYRITLTLSVWIIALQFPLGHAQVPLSNQPTPTGPWIAPDEEKGKKNPVPATKESIERGKAIFMENCATCHGKEGHGDGPSREFIPMNPANLADPKFAALRTDGEWFWKITTGRTPMNPYEDYIEEEDRWSVVNFLRTLGADAPTNEPLAASSANPKPKPVPINPQAVIGKPQSSSGSFKSLIVAGLIIFFGFDGVILWLVLRSRRSSATAR